MKKSLFVMLTVAGVILASSCNINQENTVNETKYLKESGIVFEENIVLGQDEPIYVERNYITPTETGYYYMVNDFLKFYDKAQEKSIPVCAQANCKHTSETCDAYFDLRKFRTELGIWYYNDKLYMIGTDDNYSEYALWSVNLDGTERDKVTTLYKYEGEQDNIYSITLHRGYLYYALANYDFTEPASLYQVEVKHNAKPKTIYSADESDTTIYRFKGYGDGIFFQQGNYNNGNRDDVENYSADVKYITSEGECYQVLAGPEKFYNIVDNKLYYSSDEGEIYAYDWIADTQELFFDAGAICNISFDEKYVYLDNHYGVKASNELTAEDREIMCISKSGEMVHSLNIHRHASDACIFGDEDYLWMWIYKGIEDPSEMYLSKYDKEQIDEKGIAWDSVETLVYE